MLYTAHIRKKDGVEQSVEEHSFSSERIASVNGKRINLKSTCELAALVHDFGKLNKDFNDYIHGMNKLKRGQIDHSFAGAKYIYNIARQTQDKSCYLAGIFIAKSIISHHGMTDWIDENGNDVFEKRISKNERYDEITSAIYEIADEKEIIQKLKKSANEIKEAESKIEKISQDILTRAFYRGMLERVIKSIVIDADRTDTAEFMSGYRYKPDLNKKQLNELWKSMNDKILEKYEKFKKNPDSMTEYRMNISERCAEFAGKERRICRLTVPTGGGKTLSAMRFAANYCQKFGMERIFYIAPFMSILEQNSEVFKSLLNDDNMMLEHHSDIVKDDMSDNELKDYELHCDKWNSPVISTTMVQFLNTLFSDKMSSVRRMHSVSNAVIIIDEVQSIPLKCAYLFNLAINFLANICGSTVILCTATQPCFEKLKYPLKMDLEESMTGDYTNDFKKFKRTEIFPVVKNGSMSYEEAAEFCYERFNENGSLLVVLNTKKSAQNIYSIINEKIKENNVQIYYLSTNMYPEHRKNVIDEVRSKLQNNENIICVTTQLIEAGVDISFKCAIRSLAGMDNAAQTAGRCNRNGEKECGFVYIIDIKDEKLGRLEEIKESQNISRQIYLSDFTYTDKEKMDNYFIKLYSVFRNKLEYKEKDKPSILDLLSLNKSYKTPQNKNISLGQAFKTAGSLFEVIDNNTFDLIVENKQNEEIISQLSSDIEPETAVKLLRKCQRFTINVYSSVLNKLTELNAVYTALNGEVLILKKEFYDDKLGLTLQEAEMELLMY